MKFEEIIVKPKQSESGLEKLRIMHETHYAKYDLDIEATKMFNERRQKHFEKLF